MRLLYSDGQEGRDYEYSCATVCGMSECVSKEVFNM